MKYEQSIIMKNGREALIRNAVYADGAEVFEVFTLAHAETDFLLSYPDENSYNIEQESEFLQNLTESPNAVELIAIVDGKIVGSAGIDPVGHKYKVKHRAHFGITVLKDYWGLGLGRALTNACIQCAVSAGYDQLELNVVADNDRAISLYRSVGFVEFGRNPRGFNSRATGYQELISMLLSLK